MKLTSFASLFMDLITERFVMNTDGTPKVEKWEIKCIVPAIALQSGIMGITQITPIVTIVGGVKFGEEATGTSKDFMTQYAQVIFNN